MIKIDVLTLLAPGESMDPRALAALDHQGLVEVRHRFVEGRRRAGEHRVSAITRARNEAKRLGSANYVMFLDRDVVLPALALEKLVFRLAFSPHHAALGVNYQEESPISPAPHVAMGATLFVRSVLQRIDFRWEPDACECWYCCVDLRSMGYCIDYYPGLRAEHVKLS